MLTPDTQQCVFPKKVKNMNKKLLIAVLAFVALGAFDRVSANLIISIDQTGGNNPVSVDSPRVWNFGITAAGAAYFSQAGITFDSALFDAKVHNGTTEPLVFTLFSGLGGNVAGNTALTTVSMPASAFDQKYSDGGESLFTYKPELLTMGYYSVTLTTAAPDKATEDYFLKQGTLSLLNADGTPLNSSYWLEDKGTGHATSVFNPIGGGGAGIVALAPEVNPAWAMLLVAGLSFGGSLVRRTRRDPALASA